MTRIKGIITGTILTTIITCGTAMADAGTIQGRDAGTIQGLAGTIQGIVDALLALV